MFNEGNEGNGSDDLAVESSHWKSISPSLGQNAALRQQGGWKTMMNRLDSIDTSVLAVELSYRKSTREKLGENTALWQHMEGGKR